MNKRILLIVFTITCLIFSCQAFAKDLHFGIISAIEEKIDQLREKKEVPAGSPSYIVIDTIPVGDNPGGVAVTPDGNYVYVTNEGSDNVSILFLGVQIANIPVGAWPTGVAVTPDGNYIYVTNNFDSTVSVIGP